MSLTTITKTYPVRRERGKEFRAQGDDVVINLSGGIQPHANLLTLIAKSHYE